MEEEKDKEKGNIYDQIFKSHIPIILNKVISKHLNYEVRLKKRLTEKIQKAREREMDFAAIYEADNRDPFIIHLELQSQNDSKMLDRMMEYHSLMTAKYKLPIMHFLVYMGRAKLNMPNKLPKALQFTGFHVFNYQDCLPESFINSEDPEEVMQAILAKNENPKELIETLIQRIINLSENKNEQVRYLKELRVYSKLRKLDTLFINTLFEMPIYIDENIEDDFFYKKGIAKGIAKGETKTKDEMILNLLKEGASISFIAKVANVTEDYVLNLQKK